MELELEPEEESSGDGAAWMATFADMMTLLLCFFILLLSFATMDIVKFRDAMGSVQEALGVQFEHDGQFEAVASSPLQTDPYEEAPEIGEDRALLEELNSAIEEEGLESEVSAAIDGRGVIVRINGQVLYPRGDAALKEASTAILSRIAGLAKGTSHRLMIEGHTDDLPIRTARYPSNWELSTARAIAAMRFFVEQNVDAGRVGVAGYADLRPIQPNDSEANRGANRRVEFVFIRQTDDDDAEGEDVAEADTAQADASLESADELESVTDSEEPAPAGL